MTTNIIQDSIEIYSHSNSFQRLTTASVVPRTQSLQDGHLFQKTHPRRLGQRSLGVMGTQLIPKKRSLVIFQVTQKQLLRKFQK